MYIYIIYIYIYIYLYIIYIYPCIMIKIVIIIMITSSFNKLKYNTYISMIVLGISTYYTYNYVVKYYYN